jgi:hypothetical protein
MRSRFRVRRPVDEGTTAPALARSVAWLSLGIGIATFLAPKHVAGRLGMDDQAPLIRAYGVREFTTGLGLLTGRDRTPWVTARVGGDMLDLVALVPALKRDNGKRGNVLLAVAAVVAISLLDLTCARRLKRDPMQAARGNHGWHARAFQVVDELQSRIKDLEVPRLTKRLGKFVRR